jgi:hypothetical protein
VLLIQAHLAASSILSSSYYSFDGLSLTLIRRSIFPVPPVFYLFSPTLALSCDRH